MMKHAAPMLQRAARRTLIPAGISILASRSQASIHPVASFRVLPEHFFLPERLSCPLKEQFPPCRTDSQPASPMFLDCFTARRGRQRPEHPTWRGLSAGQRPAPRSALEPGSSRRAKKRRFSSVDTPLYLTSSSFDFVAPTASVYPVGSGSAAIPHGSPAGAIIGVRVGQHISHSRSHSAASPQIKENQKAKISAPGRGPDGGGIFRGWPQSKQSSMTQSSMTQFLSGAGNWPPRGIFAAREEMGL